MTKILDSLYLTPHLSSSFGGVDNLYRKAKKKIPSITRLDIQDYLRGQDAYTLHRDAREKYRRNQTRVPSSGVQYQIDLMDIEVKKKLCILAGITLIKTVA